jgi:hypothetical protein
MQRTRVLQPGSSLSDAQGPVYYNCEDLYVGAKIVILSHNFVLLDADEYVFNYMEMHPFKFKFSGIEQTMNKMSELLKTLEPSGISALKTELESKTETNHLGKTIERQHLVKILGSLFPGKLTDHVYIYNARKSLRFQDSLKTFKDLRILENCSIFVKAHRFCLK